MPSCLEKYLWILTVKQVVSFYQTCENTAKFEQTRTPEILNPHIRNIKKLWGIYVHIISLKMHKETKTKFILAFPNF